MADMLGSQAKSHPSAIFPKMAICHQLSPASVSICPERIAFEAFRGPGLRCFDGGRRSISFGADFSAASGSKSSASASSPTSSE